jgi:hypothetical protein
MAIIEPDAAGPGGLVERAKNILLQPSQEWAKIDGERPTVGQLILGYVAPLAAIPALASVIGQVVFGVSILGVVYRPGILSAITSGVLGFVFSLAGVWIVAKVINFLAPNFNGVKDDVKSMQVAAYSTTAGALAGVFTIHPALSILAILGLYSLFLLYRGLPRLMKAPQDKALGYTALVVVVGVVLGFILGALASCVTGAGRLAAGAGSVIASGGVDKSATITVPGLGEAKVSELEKSVKQLEELGKQLESGAATGELAVTAMDVEAIKALLPESLPGGFARTEVSSSTVGAAGMSAGGAKGIYVNGDKRIELGIGDLGPAGAIAGMASAMGLQTSTENANGYERARMIDGRFTMETLDRSAGTASRMVLIANRFAVQADGRGVGDAELKAAVDAVGLGKLEKLAEAN